MHSRFFIKSWFFLFQNTIYKYQWKTSQETSALIFFVCIGTHVMVLDSWSIWYNEWLCAIDRSWKSIWQRKTPQPELLCAIDSWAERVSIAHNGLKGHTTLLFYYCKNNLKIVLTLRLKVSSLKMYYNILPKILIT